MNADTNLPNYIKSHPTHTVGIQHFIQSTSLSFVFNNFPTATAQSNKIQIQDRVFNFDTSQVLEEVVEKGHGRTNKPGAAILWSAT